MNSASDRGGVVSSVEATAEAPKGGVGAPGTAESFIPIWGSGRAAINDFQTGHPFWATFNGTLAISDAFLVRKAVMSIGQGAWKLGSHTWKQTRRWYGQSRGLAKGTPVHHWFIEQNSAFGKGVPDAIKNQPWNLMPMGSMALHNSVHGLGPDGFNVLGRAVYGTPDWAKLAAGSGLGHAIEPLGLDGDDDD